MVYEMLADSNITEIKEPVWSSPSSPSTFRFIPKGNLNHTRFDSGKYTAYKAIWSQLEADF